MRVGATHRFTAGEGGRLKSVQGAGHQGGHHGVAVARVQPGGTHRSDACQNPWEARECPVAACMDLPLFLTLPLPRGQIIAVKTEDWEGDGWLKSFMRENQPTIPLLKEGDTDEAFASLDRALHAR